MPQEVTGMTVRPDSKSCWRWVLLVASVYIFGLASLGVALRNNLGFPLDDSWIHQVIARNLVEFHTFGFTPGVASSGSSSTLWSLVLALNYLLFPHASPVYFPLALNSLMLIACGLLLWHMAIADGLPRAEALALALLPGLSGNLIWLAFTGMEHIMFLTFSLAAIALWFRRDGTIWPSALAGLALGALGATRPEGLALCGLLFVFYRQCGRSFADVVRAGVVAAMFLVPSFLLNLKTSGALLPVTLRGRRFMYSGSDKLHVGRSSFRGLILNTYKDVLAHNFFHTHTGWLVTALVALAFYGLLVLLRRFTSRAAMLCLWATLDYVAYCVTLPEPGHGGRYQPFVLLLFPPLLAIALVDLSRRLARRIGAPRAGIALQWVSVGLIAVLTAATLPRWEAVLRDGTAVIDTTHERLALWISDNYPPNTRMAVFDIGAIGYFANVQVVDLGGLVDRNYLPYLIAGRVPDYLQERGVEYVILPHAGSETHFGDLLHLLHNPALRLVPIHTVAADPIAWRNAFAYTGNAFQEQTLYRIVPVPPSEQSPAATAEATRIAANAQPE
jgi:hypothetical protein